MRIDERNVMFSRMARKEGTAAYESYYTDHPEIKSIDDEIRGLPQMGTEGTATFNVLNSPMVDAAFQFLGDIKHLADGPSKNPQKVIANPAVFTARLEGLCRLYGAVLTGVAPKDEQYYYSHRGRMDKHFGEPVEAKHPYTLVFAVEMEKALIDSAPLLPESLAVTKGYVSAAIIGMIITYYIKSLGYEARNHMDGNYLIVLPLAAKAAGLGDIGRHGLLINEQYGSRLRLGAVTTDMPLLISEPSDFKVTAFCKVCGKCVRTCPGKAIPPGDPSLHDQVIRWKIHQEECYKKWRSIGTDCGVCLSTCPFSSELPTELINGYKRDETKALDLLAYHERSYPIRPFNKVNPDWLSGTSGDQ